nr:MAG TPA: hypothetical protein [Caudoviricetes sp.]
MLRFSPFLEPPHSRVLLNLRIELKKLNRNLSFSLTAYCGSRYMLFSLAIIKKTKSMMNRSRLNVSTKNQNIFVIKIIRKMIVASLSDFNDFCVVFRF